MKLGYPSLGINFVGHALSLQNWNILVAKENRACYYYTYESFKPRSF